MSELQRTAALSVMLAGSLLITVIGLAAAVEVPRPDWVLLFVGSGLSVVTGIGLVSGGFADRRRRGGGPR